MEKNVESLFPYKIDPRIYFENLRTEQLNTKNEYEAHLQDEEYSEASASLCNSDMDYYGAYVLNLFENRFKAIAEYVDMKTKPKLVFYQEEEPENITVGRSWIGGE